MKRWIVMFTPARLRLLKGWIVSVIATGVKWNDPSAWTNPLNQDHQKKINPNQQRVSL